MSRLLPIVLSQAGGLLLEDFTQPPWPLRSAFSGRCHLTTSVHKDSARSLKTTLAATSGTSLAARPCHWPLAYSSIVGAILYHELVSSNRSPCFLAFWPMYNMFSSHAGRPSLFESKGVQLWAAYHSHLRSILDERAQSDSRRPSRESRDCRQNSGQYIEMAVDSSGLPRTSLLASLLNSWQTPGCVLQ